MSWTILNSYKSFITDVYKWSGFLTDATFFSLTTGISYKFSNLFKLQNEITTLAARVSNIHKG